MSFFTNKKRIRRIEDGGDMKYKLDGFKFWFKGYTGNFVYARTRREIEDALEMDTREEVGIRRDCKVFVKQERKPHDTK